jgi:hypothetical protein
VDLQVLPCVALACLCLAHSATPQEPAGNRVEAGKRDGAKDDRFPGGCDHDFGNVPYGSYPKHAFRIVNTSNAPIEIISVRPSGSGSLQFRVSKQILQPKEETELLLVVETLRFKGPKAVTVYVLLQKDKMTVEEIKFWIACNSDVTLKLDPRTLLQNRLMEAACKGVDVARDGPPPAPGVYLGDAHSPDIITVLKEGAGMNARTKKGSPR